MYNTGNSIIQMLKTEAYLVAETARSLRWPESVYRNYKVCVRQPHVQQPYNYAASVALTITSY